MAQQEIKLLRSWWESPLLACKLLRISIHFIFLHFFSFFSAALQFISFVPFSPVEFVNVCRLLIAALALEMMMIIAAIMATRMRKMMKTGREITLRVWVLLLKHLQSTTTSIDQNYAKLISQFERDLPSAWWKFGQTHESIHTHTRVHTIDTLKIYARREAVLEKEYPHGEKQKTSPSPTAKAEL